MSTAPLAAPATGITSRIRPDSISSAPPPMPANPAGVSFGINGPGGTLHIMAGLLVKAAGGDPKKAREIIKNEFAKLKSFSGIYNYTIRDSGDALLTIINDILDLSKINAGMITIDQVNFSLQEQLQAVYNIQRLKAKAKGLELNIELDPQLKTAYRGDPHRITQIMNNLINNAIKFTEEGSISIHGTCRSLSTEEEGKKK